MCRNFCTFFRFYLDFTPHYICAKVLILKSFLGTFGNVRRINAL